MGTQTEASGEYSTAMGVSKASGDFSIAMGSVNPANVAAGNSTTIASGDYSRAIGSSTTASGYASTAMGTYTTASGNYSTAMGFYTTASGNYSTAMGENSTASGTSSFAYSGTASGIGSIAMGIGTTAIGKYSASIGNVSTASGDQSTTMGFQTIASDYNSFVIGRYNLLGSTVTNSATEFNTSSPAFVIGNGYTNAPFVDDGRSDALTVLFDGTTTIAGDLSINSDARLKANIISLGSTLAKLLQIDGKTYTMKKDENKKQKIGVLAQDIEKVFPELVSESNGVKSVNYQGLVPVLINALKEQDSKMNEQEAKLNKQQAEINRLKKQEARIERLERLLLNS
jgi:hypothetical protein